MRAWSARRTNGLICCSGGCVCVLLVARGRARAYMCVVFAKAYSQPAFYSRASGAERCTHLFLLRSLSLSRWNSAPLISSFFFLRWLLGSPTQQLWRRRNFLYDQHNAAVAPYHHKTHTQYIFAAEKLAQRGDCTAKFQTAHLMTFWVLIISMISLRSIFTFPVTRNYTIYKSIMYF